MPYLDGVADEESKKVDDERTSASGGMGESGGAGKVRGI